jgi:hypothetical protein
VKRAPSDQTKDRDQPTLLQWLGAALIIMILFQIGPFAVGFFRIS